MRRDMSPAERTPVRPATRTHCFHGRFTDNTDSTFCYSSRAYKIVVVRFAVFFAVASGEKCILDVVSLPVRKHTYVFSSPSPGGRCRPSISFLARPTFICLYTVRNTIINLRFILKTLPHYSDAFFADRSRSFHSILYNFDKFNILDRERSELFFFCFLVR